MLVIPDVLRKQELEEIRNLLKQTQWRSTPDISGHTAALPKNNDHLLNKDERSVAAGKIILRALSANARFISFALPLKILSPIFNSYRSGSDDGLHVDNSIRMDPLSGQRIRTDISTTVFLNDPDEYVGGELIISDTYAVERIKLPPGHAVVYPGSSLHRTSPVMRGARLASFLWTQSMVQDDTQRTLLFNLDNTIQRLATRPENADDVARLTGTYHNLIRQWAQT